MNDQIAAIVDALFQNTVINEETLALHEELMNNCQEHYADLVARGETPEDALEIINDSLNGMKEVIAEYPRREKLRKRGTGFSPAPKASGFICGIRISRSFPVRTVGFTCGAISRTGSAGPRKAAGCR